MNKRSNLIDTRRIKRERSSSQDGRGSSPVRERKRPCGLPPPSVPVQSHHKDSKLRAIIYPAFIPEDKFKAIEKLFYDRGQEIFQRCDQVHKLQQTLDARNKELKGQDAKIFEQEERITSLRAAKDKAWNENRDLKAKTTFLEECVETQSQTMQIGQRCLRDKADLAKQLEADIEALRQKIVDKDLGVQTLGTQVLELATAAAPQLVQIALDTQARRTLSMVEGLRAEIVQKDALILSLKEEQMRVEYEGQTAMGQRVKDLQMAADAANRRCDKANAAAARAMKELEESKAAHEMAEKTGTEVRQVAEEQQALIDKLLEENARLSGLRGAG